MPYGLTTLKDRATQLLIKFKTGALVTQQTIFRAVTALGRIWDFFSKPVITLKPFLLVFCSSHEPFGWSHYSSVGIFARLPLFWPLFGHPSINPNEKIRVTTPLSDFDTYMYRTHANLALTKLRKWSFFIRHKETDTSSQYISSSSSSGPLHLCLRALHHPRPGHRRTISSKSFLLLSYL